LLSCIRYKVLLLPFYNYFLFINDLATFLGITYPSAVALFFYTLASNSRRLAPRMIDYHYIGNVNRGFSFNAPTLWIFLGWLVMMDPHINAFHQNSLLGRKYR